MDWTDPKNPNPDSRLSRHSVEKLTTNNKQNSMMAMANQTCQPCQTLLFLLLILGLLISGSSTVSVAVSAGPPLVRVYAKPTASSSLNTLKLLYENPTEDIVFRGPIPLQNGQPRPTSTEIVLECSAPYPIYWHYKGQGWGSDSAEVLEETEALRNVTVTHYQLDLDQGQDKGRTEYKTTISGLVLHERISGRYSCVPLERSDASTPSASSSIHLFVPYNRPPQPGGGSYPLRTLLKYQPPLEVLEVTVEEALSGEGYLLLPCSVSDPSAIVHLYKVGTDYVGQEEEVRGAGFEPSSGFSLQSRRAKDLVGEYVCKVRGEGPGRAVKDLRVRVGMNRNPQQQQAEQVKERSELVYNSRTRELTCTPSTPSPQARQGQGPSPSLKKMDCGPQLECRLRRPYYWDLPTQTTTSNVIRFPYSSVLEEGWVTCKSGSNDPSGTSGMGNPLRFILDTHSEGGFVLEGSPSTAPPIRMTVLDKEEITLPALDELVVVPREEVRVGEELRVRCHFPRSVYATGDGSWKWWVERRGGHNETLNCTSAECKVPIQGLDLKSVHCSVPLLDEARRVSTSLPLHVKGPSEPSHIKLAFVRDNQDFEQIGDDETENLPGGQRHGTTYYNKTFKGYRFTEGDFGGPAGQTLYVQCRAPFPIEWTYLGYFAPEVMTTSQRYVPKIDDEHLEDQNSYYFITEIIIGAFKEDYTGEYACRKIGDYQVQAKVYLYFAGRAEGFLPYPEETSWVQYAKTPSGAVRSRFLVPCPVSDPSAEVSLWKKDATTDKWSQAREPEHLSHKTVIKFYPKLGFEVYPEAGSSRPVTGVYECRAGQGRSQVTHVTSKVEQPQEPSEPSSPFSATPKETLVPLSPPRVQVLVCEAHEEVTLLFSDPALASSLVVSRNATGNTAYKYSALAIVETFKLRPGSVTTVECVPAFARAEGEARGGWRPRPLHKWRLTDLAPGRISKFGFDNGTNSYVCCSTGFLRPQMRIATSPSSGGGCHSVSECRLQACLKNTKCRQSAAQEGDGARGRPQRVKPTESLTGPGCTTQKVDPRVPLEGALVCDLGEGDVPYVSFSYLLYHRDPESNSEVHSTFWNMNTVAIRGEGEAEGAVGLLKVRRGPLAWGDPNKFVCEGSKFFFSLGFYWVLHHEGGGEKEYVSGADGAVEKMSASSSGPVYKSSLTLTPKQLGGVRRIECVAPEWNSYLWRSASLDL